MFSQAMRATLLILFLIASTAGALNLFPVSEGPGDAHHCRVAISPFGTVQMAWEQNGRIWTWGFAGCMVIGPTDHGPGEMPDLCWAQNAYYLAWAEGDLVRLQYGEWDYWTDVEPAFGGLEPVRHIALTGEQTGAPFEAPYLCWETTDGAGWFTRSYGGDWHPGMLVREGEPFQHTSLRALPAETEQGVWPRVYYLVEDRIEYIDGVADQWDLPPQTARDGLGGTFDAAAGPLYSQHILSLGLQPTCPCGTIHYTEQMPGEDWIIPENLTVEANFYDWPFDPAVGVDEQWRARAFWLQEERNEWMEYTGETMYTFVREGGGWIDESEVFEGHAGGHCDLFVEPWGPASFAWCEEGDEGRQVWLASPHAPGIGVETPAPAVALSVHPNPFNPHTTVRFSLSANERLRLSLHDTEGRMLVELADDLFSAGDRELRFDGKDRNGRQLASGVYFLRLSSESGRREATKLVLLR